MSGFGGWGGGCILCSVVLLQHGRVGEVLFASNMDSSRRERATNGECELKTRGCDAVRCVRSIRGDLLMD